MGILMEDIVVRTKKNMEDVVRASVYILIFIFQTLLADYSVTPQNQSLRTPRATAGKGDHGNLSITLSFVVPRIHPRLLF